MLTHVVEHVEAVDVRHLQIEQQQIDGAVLQEEERGVPVAGFVDLVALRAQIVSEREAFDGGVIAEQQSRRRGIGEMLMRLHAGDYFAPHRIRAMLKTAISAAKCREATELQIVAAS